MAMWRRGCMPWRCGPSHMHSMSIMPWRHAASRERGAGDVLLHVLNLRGKILDKLPSDLLAVRLLQLLAHLGGVRVQGVHGLAVLLLELADQAVDLLRAGVELCAVLLCHLGDGVHLRLQFLLCGVCRCLQLPLPQGVDLGMKQGAQLLKVAHRRATCLRYRLQRCRVGEGFRLGRALPGRVAVSRGGPRPGAALALLGLHHAAEREDVPAALLRTRACRPVRLSALLGTTASLLAAAWLLSARCGVVRRRAAGLPAPCAASLGHSCASKLSGCNEVQWERTGHRRPAKPRRCCVTGSHAGIRLKIMVWSVMPTVGHTRIQLRPSYTVAWYYGQMPPALGPGGS
mmetsp:Transcript_40910/g.102869  ORF Transcript_40910/g.102869 Transcript_40910/m.102869 type:complete len:344 (+) Transcript_40910:509-1540(+)